MAKRKESDRLNFTKAALTRLAAPVTGRQYTYDRKAAGLAVCVTATGAKSFYVYRRVDGRPQRVRLGGFPELSVEQARKKAAVVNAQIAQGRDPMKEKRATRVAATLGEVFDRWLANHAKPRLRTWREEERKFKTCLARWRSRPLTSITSADVAALHARLGKRRGPYMANRVFELLRVLFNYAIRDGWEYPNPCVNVSKFREHGRDRFLDADEMHRFFQALADESGRNARDAIIIMLLTGARRGNVLAMRWDDLDLRRGIWRIPATESKSGEPLVVILPEHVTGLLGDRARSATGEFVFPGRGRTNHLVEIRRAWNRLRKKAGLPDLRMHDLRRTLGSWQAAAGASLPIIGKSLGHKSVAATAIYARLDLDPVRESVNTAARAMLVAGNSRGDRNGD